MTPEEIRIYRTEQAISWNQDALNELYTERFRHLSDSELKIAKSKFTANLERLQAELIK